MAWACSGSPGSREPDRGRAEEPQAKMPRQLRFLRRRGRPRWVASEISSSSRPSSTLLVRLLTWLSLRLCLVYVFSGSLSGDLLPPKKEGEGAANVASGVRPEWPWLGFLGEKRRRRFQTARHAKSTPASSRRGGRVPSSASRTRSTRSSSLQRQMCCSHNYPGMSVSSMLGWSYVRHEWESDQ